MVIEFLTFTIPPSEKADWLRVEEEHWSRFLERQRGFVRKQMWEDADDPSTIHAVIWWESLDDWMAIPKEELTAVMEAMGEWEREAALSTFNVIRDC